MTNKRKDNKGRVLHNGEYQQTNGRYRFKYYDGTGKKDIYTVGNWIKTIGYPMAKGMDRH